MRMEVARLRIVRVERGQRRDLTWVIATKIAIDGFHMASKRSFGVPL